MSKPIVVFDLDGTLIDTAPDLVDTLNFIFDRHRIPPVPYAEARNMIGGGARMMIERGLIKHRLDAAKPRVEALFAEYLVHYNDHLADRSEPFPGLPQALDILNEQGFLLAVCTNKLERLAVKLLDALGLSPRFAAICGQDTFSVMKPHPDALLHTIARAGGDPAAAVMVGDSGTDIAVAKAAAIPVVAVDFGYTEVPVHELGPDRIIGHYDELPAVVRALAPLSTGTPSA